MYAVSRLRNKVYSFLQFISNKELGHVLPRGRENGEGVLKSGDYRDKLRWCIHQGKTTEMHRRKVRPMEVASAHKTQVFHQNFSRA